MRRLLSVAVLAALAPMASAMRLVEPQQGATLRGGSFATIEWSARQLPANSEEWEAFLSLDGGQYYAFRITPHLDLDVRRFTWVVPNVATNNARLLIRTGDERRETLFEFSAKFSIAYNATAELRLPSPIARGRAEAARPGDPDVIGWASGARNGSNVTHQNSTTTSHRAFVQSPKSVRDDVAVVTTSAIRVDAPLIVALREVVADDRERGAETPARSQDLLLVCRRLNV